MAKKNAEKTQQKANETPSQAHQNHLDRLQGTLEDVCDRIADGGARSFVSRAIRARSVDPKVVEAGFREMEAAIKRGRESYAEAQRDDTVATVARVDLRTL